MNKGKSTIKSWLLIKRLVQVKAEGCSSTMHSCLSVLDFRGFFTNDMFSFGRWEQALKNKFFGGKLAAWIYMYLGTCRVLWVSAPPQLSWPALRCCSPAPSPYRPPNSLADHCQVRAKMTTPIQDLLWILLILLCACLIKLPRWLFLQPGDFTQMNVLASLSPAAKIQLICKWK